MLVALMGPIRGPLGCSFPYGLLALWLGWGLEAFEELGGSPGSGACDRSLPVFLVAGGGGSSLLLMAKISGCLIQTAAACGHCWRRLQRGGLQLGVAPDAAAGFRSGGACWCGSELIYVLALSMPLAYWSFRGSRRPITGRHPIGAGEPCYRL